MEKNMRLGIVVSEFNYDINQMMLERAEEHAEFLGAEVEEVLRVPGVFDMPLGIKKLLEKDDIDGVVTLGTVIKGETKHDETVMSHAARKITDLELEYDKPVSLGITGPGMSRMQAEERIERAKNAVESAVKMYERTR
ncbi:MAG: 6,7-dimethyl-8-ribityllumazine synthase [Candidatus Natronoplasma sp.]